MSLLGSLQLARNALTAVDIGLQVAGNNIANANTPDYIRQQAIYTSAPTQKFGTLTLGLGVEVSAIRQYTDRFLEERLRSATSDLSSAEAQEQAYSQLERIIGELGDSDLSSNLNSFFNSIHDVLNQSESVATRNLAVIKGQAVADSLSRLRERVLDERINLNDEVVSTASDINRLVQEIAGLNVKIAATEGGDTTASDAIGLRDQRQRALTDLAKIVDVQTYEQPTGAVTVMAGGDFLVADGVARRVEVAYSPNDEFDLAAIHISDSRSPIESGSGRLAGLLEARDQVTGGFLEQLDEFSNSLIYEFNRVFSTGQGLVGNRSLESEFAVNESGNVLDTAGLKNPPVNGSFKIQVLDRQTGLTRTTDIAIRLNGLDDDTTLDGLVNALDAVDGISASVTTVGKLSISAETSNLEFAFSDDSSGVLASLGLAGFFTGTNAGDIGVSAAVRRDPRLFAASRGGIGKDTNNAVLLANFLDTPLESADGASIGTLYQNMTTGVFQNSATSRSVAEGFRVFQQTLDSQKMSLSGVSIDEEAVRVITLQRTYQAAAKYISTISDLLDILVNL